MSANSINNKIAGVEISGVPTVGQVLTASSATTAEWQNPAFIGCRITQNANTSCGNDSLTVMNFAGTDSFDTDTMHDTATDNSRITFNTAGKYHIGAVLTWQNNTTGGRGIYIRKNGGDFIAGELVGAATGASQTTVNTVSSIYEFAEGDYIELYAVQKSGGALNVWYNDTAPNHFYAYKIG